MSFSKTYQEEVLSKRVPKNPGSRGGVGYWTGNGTWKYGQRPEGQQPHPDDKLGTPKKKQVPAVVPREQKQQGKAKTLRSYLQKITGKFKGPPAKTYHTTTEGNVVYGDPDAPGKKDHQWYHGTDEETARRIMKEGLKPYSIVDYTESGSPEYPDDYEDYWNKRKDDDPSPVHPDYNASASYWTGNPQEAGFYARARGNGKNGVVFSGHLPKPRGNFGEPERKTAGATGHMNPQATHFGTIPPSDLKLVGSDHVLRPLTEEGLNETLQSYRKGGINLKHAKKLRAKK